MHVDFAREDAELTHLYADMCGMDDDLELIIKNQTQTLILSLREKTANELCMILIKYLDTVKFRKHRMSNPTDNEKEEVMPTKQ